MREELGPGRAGEACMHAGDGRHGRLPILQQGHPSLITHWKNQIYHSVGSKPLRANWEVPMKLFPSPTSRPAKPCGGAEGHGHRGGRRRGEVGLAAAVALASPGRQDFSLTHPVK